MARRAQTQQRGTKNFTDLFHPHSYIDFIALILGIEFLIPATEEEG